MEEPKKSHFLVVYIYTHKHICIFTQKFYNTSAVQVKLPRYPYPTLLPYPIIEEEDYIYTWTFASSSSSYPVVLALASPYPSTLVFFLFLFFLSQ